MKNQAALRKRNDEGLSRLVCLIKRLMAREKISQAEFSRRIGVTAVRVTRWMRGDSEIPAKLLPAIAVALKEPEESFLEGKTGKTANDSGIGLCRIPIYENEASAGNGSFSDRDRLENFLTVREEIIRAELGVSCKDLAVIRVRGDSMIPTVAPGDMVIVDCSEKTVSTDGIYVLRLNGGLLVKRIQLLPGELNIISDNEKYPSSRISTTTVPDDFRIAGRVVATLNLRRL